MAMHSRFCICLVSRKVTQTLGYPIQMRESGIIKRALEGTETVWQRRVACVCDVIQVGFQTTLPLT